MSDLSKYQATGLVELHPNTTWWHPGEDRFQVVYKWLKENDLRPCLNDLMYLLLANDLNFFVTPSVEGHTYSIVGIGQTHVIPNMYFGQSLTFGPALCEAVAKWLQNNLITEEIEA